MKYQTNSNLFVISMLAGRLQGYSPHIEAVQCSTDGNRHWPFIRRWVHVSFACLAFNSAFTETFCSDFRCHAAMMQPDAFVATIFIEPILFQMKAQTEGLAKKTLRRRDQWESK